MFIVGCVRVGDDVFLWLRKEGLCVFEGEGKPHVGYQLPCLIIREMGLFAFMWLRDQDNALVYAIRLGMGALDGVMALC